MKCLNIGLPGRPSHRLISESTDMTSFLVTHGGGVGGAKKTFYGTITKSDENVIHIIDFMDRKYILTKRFIVLQEPVTVVKDVVNVTDHPTFNPTKKARLIRFRYFVVKQGETYNISNEYYGFDDGANYVLMFDKES